MNLSEFWKKTFADQKSRARQKGQAVLEYVLVLLVTVSIILGITYQFNSAFKEYVNTFFGDYIACLLETGELPQLGGSGPASGECTKPPFDLASGDTLDTSSNGGSSGNSDNSSSGDSSSDSNSSPLRSANNSSRNRPSRVTRNGGTSNGEGTAAASSQSGRPGRIRKSSTIVKSGKSNSGFGEESSDGFNGRRGRTTRKKKIIYLNDDYLTEAAKKKKERRVIAKVLPPQSGGVGQTLRKPRIPLNLPEPKIAKDDDNISGLSIGNLIKFLLIIGILIAIFMFLGGQAMQIKKGWQKSE